MLGIKIPHIPAEFLYIQTYNYIVTVTSVVCPVALMAHATAAHAAVSFAAPFTFDVYCPCCLTLFIPDRGCMSTLLMENADACMLWLHPWNLHQMHFVQQLTEQDKRVRRRVKVSLA